MIRKIIYVLLFFNLNLSVQCLDIFKNNRPAAKVSDFTEGSNINPQYFAVAAQQEEERQHNLANYNYNLAFKNQDDKDFRSSSNKKDFRSVSIKDFYEQYKGDFLNYINNKFKFIEHLYKKYTREDFLNYIENIILIYKELGNKLSLDSIILDKSTGHNYTQVYVIKYGLNSYAFKRFYFPLYLEVGMQELLESLIALAINPKPHDIKMAKIITAVHCPQQITIVSEGAVGHDIHYFLNEETQATNAIKACANYLKLFHDSFSNSNFFSHDLSLQRFINYQKNFRDYHLTKYENLLNGKTFKKLFEKKELFEKLFEKKELFEKLEGYFKSIYDYNLEMIDKISEDVDKISQDIFSPHLTVTHGDAHGRNLFYNPEDNSEAFDSSSRITMIDFGTMARTYQGTGDPAEDVGRFVGSLWDWASEKNELLIEKTQKWEKEFLNTYYHGTNKLDEKRVRFYEFRYYKVIFEDPTKNPKAKENLLYFLIKNNWDHIKVF